MEVDCLHCLAPVKMLFLYKAGNCPRPLGGKRFEVLWCTSPVCASLPASFNSAAIDITLQRIPAGLRKIKLSAFSTERRASLVWFSMVLPLPQVKSLF